ncbi:MAG TPA: heterodisulfide reductase-related iron-sulfur binding cluster [Planctomycetota bacterium]|nr:heterodisulfide reductase-related iron-sulfur binding cluster [Planctomycetota bacterium]
MSDESAVFSYYPGCMATETAREYDASIRTLAGLCDVILDEIDDWNCCGADVVKEAHPEAAVVLAQRNLELAAQVVVSGCPVCVRRLQEASRAERAMHVLGVFARADVREKLRAKIEATGEERPLGSMKVACFYGRALSDAVLWGGGDGPWPMDVLMGLAGATVVKWSGGRRPSGGYALLATPEEGFETLAKVFRDFEKSDADAIVTADPHAHFNLDSFQYTVGRRRRRALDVPVFHFTELLALAMGLERADKWLSRHITGTFTLIDRLVAEEDERKRAEGRRHKPEARSTKHETSTKFK